MARRTIARRIARLESGERAARAEWLSSVRFWAAESAAINRREFRRRVRATPIGAGVRASLVRAPHATLALLNALYTACDPRGGLAAILAEFTSPASVAQSHGRIAALLAAVPTA